MGDRLIGPVNYYANVNFSDQDSWHDNQNKRFSSYLALSAQQQLPGLNREARYNNESDFMRWIIFRQRMHHVYRYVNTPARWNYWMHPALHSLNIKILVDHPIL